MSSVPVIIAIVVLLAGLVCYAFIAQTVSQKKQQKERLLLALKSRIRNFKFMLSGFPPGFLPKELTLLVQKSLAQLLDQLSKMEPNHPGHKEDLKTIVQQMAETQRLQQNQPSSPIENPKQAREIKTSLEELYKYVFQLEGKKQLTGSQAEAYRNTIRQLVIQLTLDSCALQSRLARDKGKPRLALHYVELALKLALKERNGGRLDNQIAQLRATRSELERLVNESPATEENSAEEADSSAINSEWDKFAQEQQNWKKKQIYD